jgi:hypothetical protein
MVKLKGYTFLNNKNVLYIVFLVSILNLVGFMYNKDYQSVFLFSCIALITYMFNNNMIIVLLFSLIFVNTLIFLNRLNIHEGMKENIEISTINEKSKLPPPTISYEPDIKTNTSGKNITEDTKQSEQLQETLNTLSSITGDFSDQMLTINDDINNNI